MRNIDEIKALINDYASALKYAEKCSDRAAQHVYEGLSELKDELRLALVNGIPHDELETMCKAWKDGRCVVLPCKVGDTVWDGYGKTWAITTIEQHLDGKIIYRCGNKGTDDYRAFFNDDIGETIFLTESEGKAAEAKWLKRLADFKTEAAEAALKEQSHE